MKKLLLTVSTLSLLLATSGQEARAEGVSEWFKGIFSNEESIESDAEMHDETDVGHEVMEDHYGDNEAEYTPYEEEPEDDSSSDEKEVQGPQDTSGEDTDIEGDDKKESTPVKDISPTQI